ncbi:MAG: hypothetical protein NT051_01280 [Candidatus Micrarchaeota archaeon]|nr:hypothetical protein [Candidatus Micrarchaeota archaeon]
MTDKIFELAQRVAHEQRPEDIEQLRNTPGAKEYLISILPLATKDGERETASYSRTTVAASALGEIGTKKDAAHLNAVLIQALTARLILASRLKIADVVFDFVGTDRHTPLTENVASEYNMAEMMKAMADATVYGILNSMFKLNAQSQAVKTIESVSKNKLRPSQKEDIAELAGRLTRMMDEKKAAASLAKTAISKMKSGAQEKPETGVKKDLLKN